MQIPQSKVDAPGRFVSLETADPSQLELALRPWELLARPTSAQAFRHRITMLRGPTFIIYRESYATSMSIVGLGPPGMLAIGLPQLHGEGTRYWNQVHTNSSIPLSMPGPLDVSWNHAHEQIVALISIDALRVSLKESEFEHLVSFAHFNRIDLPSITRTKFSASLKATLNSCQHHPEYASSPRFLNDIYEGLVSYLSLMAQQTMPAQVAPSVSARKRGFRLAAEFLSEHPSNIPSMAELCRVAGTSERTLQYAFQDAFKMTPREFLIRRRLHAARLALLIGNPASDSVGSVAMNHGFYELGRFAGTYRQYFGELPSKTLRTIF